MSSDAAIIAKVARRAADPEKRIDGEPHYDPLTPLSDPDFFVELGFGLPGLFKARPRIEAWADGVELTPNADSF